MLTMRLFDERGKNVEFPTSQQHHGYPTKAWKTEYAKLTVERKTLNQRYLVLKKEVKEAEKIRKSVYSILRQEQWEQPRRTQDMER